MLSQLMSYDQNTILLYFGIVFVSTILAVFSQRGLSGSFDYGVSVKLPYVLSFFNSAFFVSFTTVGADRANYAYFFQGITFDRILHGSEPGFELIQFVVYQIIKNPNVFIVIICLWTVYNIYRGLWEFKNDISLGMAIFIYVSQYYFQSFSLIRIYFAASLLIRFAYLIKEEKYVKYAIVILIAVSMHYSVLFALIAYVLSFAFLKSRQLSGFKFYLLVALSIGFSTFGTGTVGLLVNFSGNAVISKYSLFLTGINGNQLGLKWIFNIIPYLLVFSFRKTFADEEKKYMSFTMAYLIIALSVSLLSYYIPVIGRGLIVLNMPILVILPLGMGMFRNKRYLYPNEYLRIGTRKIGIKMSYRGIRTICLCWGFVSLVMYLSEYVPIDKIDNFRFIWS